MSLNPHVVEKDYVLGWLLAGIDAHPVLRETWVFKGGTCLKKCFFETYRFSEDLDFTLTDPKHLDERFLKDAFAQVANWLYDHTGLEVPTDKQVFDLYTNPRGKVSCQGKLSYRGPVSPRDMPRIKLDLTADERLVLEPVRTAVFHPYSDAPEGGIEVLAYAYEEVFGEKVRALAERTRPRDLYDVIHLFRNADARPSADVVNHVLLQKCDFKGISMPTFAHLEPHRDDMESMWKSMLAHQLPSLPPPAPFWEELPAFFDWLSGQHEPVTPAAYALAEGDTVLRQRSLAISAPSGARGSLEIIRYAASNRLIVELDYKGRTRRIEAYSLRRTRAGNVLLHAIDIDVNGHRSYSVDLIAGVRVTNQTFTPRFRIELSPQGPALVPPAARHQRPRTVARSTRASGKPVYIYECPVCSKQFRRSRHDSRLKPHKDKSGRPCFGRAGFYVETRY